MLISGVLYGGEKKKAQPQLKLLKAQEFDGPN